MEASDIGKSSTAIERQKDQKRAWIQKMVRSAKLHHKLCPFYDRKKKFCFLRLGEKCQFDGKFDNCPIFIGFLERRYDEITASGKSLPVDFEDPLVQFGVT